MHQPVTYRVASGMYPLGYAHPEPQPLGVLEGDPIPRHLMHDPELRLTHGEIMYIGEQVRS